MKTIYLIRHSAPFVKLFNYSNKPFEEQSQNMILSIDGERKAEELSKLEIFNNIDDIYSSNSARAIGTAKYIAERNNLDIKIDDRINERKFGITYINEIPKDYNEHQFCDDTYKINNGESLEDVKKRFCEFISEILKDDKTIVLSIHGVNLMAYLSTIANVSFSNDTFVVTHNGNKILNGLMSNPDIYKIEYEKQRVINITRVILSERK